MRALFLLVTAILTFQACIPLNSPGATGNSVYVGNFYFSPVTDSGTMDKDDQLVVTFRWVDSTSGIGHSVVFDSGPEGVPPGIGQMFSGYASVVFTVPGRYVYHCSFHENFGMVGVIEVVPFGVGTASRAPHHPNAAPIPTDLIQPSPEAAQESPRQAARQSQPATS
jgi:hypothetical protein